MTEVISTNKQEVSQDRRLVSRQERWSLPKRAPGRCLQGRSVLGSLKTRAVLAVPLS